MLEKQAVCAIIAALEPSRDLLDHVLNPTKTSPNRSVKDAGCSDAEFTFTMSDHERYGYRQGQVRQEVL